MKLLVILTALAIATMSDSERTPQNAGLPLVHAAWTQPQGRLFAVCPNDARNYPHARESKA